MQPKIVIVIEGGRHIRTGTAVVDNTVAGWCACGVSDDGAVSLRGTVRGETDPVYARLTADALFRNNPWVLHGQLVRHPAPPSQMDGADWVVDATDWMPSRNRWEGRFYEANEEPSTLTLIRMDRDAHDPSECVRSTVPVHDLVLMNLDELRTRIKFERES